MTDFPLTTEEESTIRKVVWRFVPFLIVCYFVSYLDKVNIGFAALSMNKALGLTPSQYGFGAGIFFFTYALCEIPSNLALTKVGARRWLARIMISWGVVSAATAFVSNAPSFYAIRLLLGACEAGFFPGIIFFLGTWFPKQYRARAIGFIDLAIPMSSVIGAPLSGQILKIENTLWGIENWQWLFLLESLPAVLLGIFMLFWLTDKPEEAHWLTDDERARVVTLLRREWAKHSSLSTDRPEVAGTLRNKTVLALVVIYFGIASLHLVMAFWLPQIIHEFGFSVLKTSLLAALPYLVGAIGMLLWSRLSDRHGERRRHATIALALATCGFALSALVDDPMLQLAAFCLAAFGAYGTLPVFWSMPADYLPKEQAAVGIAFINCVGALSGLFAPWFIGVIRQQTGSFRSGLFAVTACAAVSLVTMWLMPIATEKGFPKARQSVE